MDSKAIWFVSAVSDLAMVIKTDQEQLNFLYLDKFIKLLKCFIFHVRIINTLRTQNILLQSLSLLCRSLLLSGLCWQNNTACQISEFKQKNIKNVRFFGKLAWTLTTSMHMASG